MGKILRGCGPKKTLSEKNSQKSALQRSTNSFFGGPFPVPSGFLCKWLCHFHVGTAPQLITTARAFGAHCAQRGQRYLQKAPGVSPLFSGRNGIRCRLTAAGCSPGACRAQSPRRRRQKPRPRARGGFAAAEIARAAHQRILFAIVAQNVCHSRINEYYLFKVLGIFISISHI